MNDDLVLVSSCLAGIPCRYDGNARPDPSIVEAVESGCALPACAEQLGGLSTPRRPAEIVGGDGHDVLIGTARVVTIDGDDITDAFTAGAQAVARLAEENGITQAILQSFSPSCGCGTIYDGTHSGRLTAGDGVVTAALKHRGIDVTTVRGLSTSTAR